ncbi:MAG: hypothetical protein IH840_15275 [Candidatus Heimdallarchaeota archaeon]|nr:hypothetical protein [Candidatus Heimdallarchaeota archaeon]
MRRQLSEFDFNSKNKLLKDRIPEPYLGNPFDCRAAILNQNPSSDARDVIIHNTDAGFRERSFKNLMHEVLDHPFYLLDPSLEHTPGSAWWSKYLETLIQDVSLSKVTKNLCVVELFPYHAKNKQDFLQLKDLDSVKYSHFLVNQIMAREIPIIIMRSKKEWISAVPNLANYPTYELKNVRQIWITPSNMKNNGYLVLKNALV